MDDKRFDELSRRLAVPLTRASFFKTLSALGGSALVAITGLDLAEAKKGHGGGKKKGRGKKGRGKKENRGQQDNGLSARNDTPVSGQVKPPDDCTASGKVLVCHEDGQSGKYNGLCVDSSATAC